MKKLLILFVLFFVAAFVANAKTGLNQPTNAEAKMSISIKKVTHLKKNFFGKLFQQKKITKQTTLSGYYEVTFTPTCSSEPITFYVSCYNCSYDDLMLAILPGIGTRNFNSCQTVPTFMLFQYTEV